MTQIVLTSGTSWAVPGDYVVSGSKVEAIGGGAGGNTAGFGGGGGEYRKIVDFNPGAGPITYAIGQGGAATVNGGDTTWNTSSLIAKGGTSATGVGGTGGTGTTGFNGGVGGPTSGGGGGGAGTTAIGGAGGDLGAEGGPGGADLGGAGGTDPSPAPTTGTVWGTSPNYGSGGGGSGKNIGGGQAGALYGGGGGGGSTGGGAGANGIIVITYTGPPAPIGIVRSPLRFT